MNNPNIVHQSSIREHLSLDNQDSIQLSITQLTFINKDAQETVRVHNQNVLDTDEEQPVYCLIKAKVIKPGSDNRDSRKPSSLEETRIYLTPREKHVLRGLSKGLSYSETARNLSISENTLRTHIKHIYEKMGVNNRLQAVNKAHEMALF